MAKKITGYVKLQVPAGAANPSPPIGPALGQRGLNIMEFCKAFNAKTAQMEKGTPIPVVITAFQDRSFTVEMKLPPVSFFLKKASGIQSGSKTAGARNCRSTNTGDHENQRRNPAVPWPFATHGQPGERQQGDGFERAYWKAADRSACIRGDHEVSDPTQQAGIPDGRRPAIGHQDPTTPRSGLLAVAYDFRGMRPAR